jgi:hypothetical protein
MFFTHRIYQLSRPAALKMSEYLLVFYVLGLGVRFI